MPIKLIRAPQNKWNSGPQEQFHYRHFGTMANRIADMFSAQGEPIKPQSELNELIVGAHALSAIAELPAEQFNISPLNYYHALSFARLARSVLNLDYRPSYRQYFRDMSNGTINLWNAAPSKAKDTEWELLLWSQLNNTFPGAARLAEPDIVLQLAHRRIGIACKRVYSFRRVIDQIRSGARQLKANNLSGIVALAFDPYEGNQDGYCLLKAPTMEDAGGATFNYFGQIWKRAGAEVIRKYLIPNKVIGLIIAVQGFVQLGDAGTNIADLSATRLQTYPQSPVQYQEIMDILHHASTGDYGSLEAGLLTRLKHLEELSYWARQR